MSDRTAATIRIGGGLSPRQVYELVELALTETDGLEFEAYSTEEELREKLKEVSGKECLELRAHDTSGGVFDDLEQWLKEECLAFHRWTAPHYWTCSYICSWDPETRAERVTYASEDGTPLAPLAEARELLERANNLEEALEDWLWKHCPTPLPPILLVEWTGHVIR